MSSTNFRKRLNKGKILSDELCEYLDAHNIEYLLTGYEHLNGTENAHDMLKKCHDKTSRFLRYYPDLFIILAGKSCLIEIKNSSGIERECYQSYFYLKDALDINIMLFLRNRKLCTIEGLKLQPVKSYDHIAKMDVPVADGVWKSPRDMIDNPQYDPGAYRQYKEAYASAEKYTSGCSFAFIDFESTPFWDKNIIEKQQKRLTHEGR